MQYQEVGSSLLPTDGLFRLNQMLFELFNYRMQRVLRISAIFPHILLSLVEMITHCRNMQLYRGCEFLILQLTTAVPDAKVFRTLLVPMADSKFSFQENELVRRVLFQNLCRSVRLNGDNEINTQGMMGKLLSMLLHEKDTYTVNSVNQMPLCVRELYEKTYANATTQSLSYAHDALQEAIHLAIEKSSMHNALLPRGQTAEAEKALMEYYSNEAHQPLFLCIVWHITVLQKAINFTMPNIRKVMLLFPARRISSYTFVFARYIVNRSYSGISEQAMATWLSDFIFKYALLSFETVLFALINAQTAYPERALKLFEHLLFTCPEFQLRVDSFLSLGISPFFWNEKEHAIKQNEYLKKHPEYFDYEAFVSLSNISSSTHITATSLPSPTSSLPMYYDNVCMRFATWMIPLLHQLIEHQHVYTIEKLLSRYGKLFIYSATPVKAIYELLFYFSSAIQPSIARSLARVAIMCDRTAFSSSFVACIDSNEMIDYVNNEYLSDRMTGIVSAYSSNGFHLDETMDEVFDKIYNEHASPVARSVCVSGIELLVSGLLPHELIQRILTWLSKLDLDKSNKTMEDICAGVGLLLARLPESSRLALFNQFKLEFAQWTSLQSISQPETVVIIRILVDISKVLINY